MTRTATRSRGTCQLDGQVYTCNPGGGVTLENLSQGSHTFSVAAYNADGRDPTPASRTWTVDTEGTAPPADTTPPAVTIGGGKCAKAKKGVTTCTLSGTATDASGVASVEINAYRKAGKNCFALMGGKWKKLACATAANTWVKATVSGGKWTLVMRGVIPRTAYKVSARATDTEGNKSAKPVTKTIKLK